MFPASAHIVEYEWAAAARTLCTTAFGSRNDAARAIKDFVSLQQGKQVKLDKGLSGKMCASFKCSCATCNMTIRARCDGGGDWTVKVGDFTHGNCTGVAKLSTAQLAAIPHVGASVDAQPNIPSKALGKTVQNLENISVRRFTLNRVKARIKTLNEAAYDENCSRMPAYCKALEVLNPGTTAFVELGDGNCITRVFMLLGACAKAAQLCIPLSSIDSSHLRHYQYNGQLAVLEFVDPSMHNLPDDSPNGGNYFGGIPSLFVRS